MNTIVSIIVPIYNISDEYLDECLKTLQRQTYKNIEIITVIDGSPNKNNEILCKKYQRKDARFKVLVQPNGGVSVARNNGLKAAKGEWIAFVDPDDWLSPEYIETMLINVNSDTEIIICDCYVEYESKTVINHFFPNSLSANEIKPALVEQLFGRNKIYNPPEIAVGVPWGKLYKKDFLNKNNLFFDSRLRRMQDNIFNLYAFDIASYIEYIDIPLYHYRKYTNSVSCRFSPKIFTDFDNIIKATYKFISDKHNNDQRYEQLFYKRILQSFVPYCKYYFFNRNNKNTYKENKYIFLEIVKKSFYRKAINNLAIEKLNLEMFILFFLVKYHLFALLKIVYNIRYSVKK